MEKKRIMFNEIQSRVGKTELFRYIRNVIGCDDCYNEMHHVGRNITDVTTMNDLLCTSEMLTYCVIVMDDLFYKVLPDVVKKTNLKPIILLRRNVLHLFLSERLSLATESWGSHNLTKMDENTKNKLIQNKIIFDEPYYNEYIKIMVDKLQVYLELLRENNIDYMIVFYEDLYESGKEQKLKCVNEILDFCGHKKIDTLIEFPNSNFTKDTIPNRLEYYKELFVFPDNFDKIVNAPSVFDEYKTGVVINN